MFFNDLKWRNWFYPQIISYFRYIRCLLKMLLMFKSNIDDFFSWYFLISEYKDGERCESKINNQCFLETFGNESIYIVYLFLLILRKITFFLDWINIKFKHEILLNNVMNANKATNLLMDLVFFQITVHQIV
jgi:hypothetical protein